MRNYKNYEVWIESHELVKFIYKQITPNLPADEKYALVSQMKRLRILFLLILRKDVVEIQKRTLHIFSTCLWVRHLNLNTVFN